VGAVVYKVVEMVKKRIITPFFRCFGGAPISVFLTAVSSIPQIGSPVKRYFTLFYHADSDIYIYC
jgi:hypothetical protein